MWMMDDSGTPQVLAYINPKVIQAKLWKKHMMNEIITAHATSSGFFSCHISETTLSCRDRNRNPRRSTRLFRRGATVDLPPPPTEVGEGGGGVAGYL